MWSGCWASAGTSPRSWVTSSLRTDDTRVPACIGPEANDRSTAACSSSWLAGTNPLLPMAETTWASAMQRKAAGHLRVVSENQSHKIGCWSAVGRVGRQSTLNCPSVSRQQGLQCSGCGRWQSHLELTVFGT
jgi:hypothetical protein